MTPSLPHSHPTVAIPTPTPACRLIGSRRSDNGGITGWAEQIIIYTGGKAVIKAWSQKASIPITDVRTLIIVFVFFISS